MKAPSHVIGFVFSLSLIPRPSKPTQKNGSEIIGVSFTSVVETFADTTARIVAVKTDSGAR
jgi:hypothetical protein